MMSFAERGSALAARMLVKTGRRLTSDPIRTSLGLLPSGSDPVGEWLVHRQSPGPYLGPKGAESKRGGVHSSALRDRIRHSRRALQKYVDARPQAGHEGCCLQTESLRRWGTIPRDFMSESAWSLHSQLKKDTIDIGDLPLCRVLVIKDAHYPWLLLVPPAGHYRDHRPCRSRT